MIVGRDVAVFPKWSSSFIELSEFREFRESDKPLKHEFGFNLKILFLTCVLLAQWQYPGLLHKS